jgi:hypothetical protein
MKKPKPKQDQEKNTGIIFKGDAKIIGPVNTGPTGDITYSPTVIENTGQGAQLALHTTGDVTQSQGLSGPELLEIQKLFADLRRDLAQQDLSPETKVVGEEFISQLEQEVSRQDAPPDGSTIKVAGGWLLKNVPAIAGSLANLFINPIVGKVIEAGGEVASRWVQEKFYPAKKGT